MLSRVVAITAGLVLACTAGAGPVQAATPVLMGVHDDVSPAELKQRYPGVRATREFVSGVQGTSADLRKKYDAVAKASWAAGLVPFVSIKTDPDKTGDGTYDARFRELAEWLADKPDSYFVWYHEPTCNGSRPARASTCTGTLRAPRAIRT